MVKTFLCLKRKKSEKYFGSKEIFHIFAKQIRVMTYNSKFIEKLIIQYIKMCG